MARKQLIENLSSQVPIANADGTPTPQFMRVIQKLAITGALSKDTAGAIQVGSGAVSLAMIQNIADKMILANNAGVSGPPLTLTMSQILDFLGVTRGSIIYRGASGWTLLAPGTSGNVLQTNGAGADPTWVTPAAGGGGALVLLEQHTASGSATLDFTTGITATYDEYVFEFVDLVPAAASNLWMRCSTNGGSTYDSSAIYDFVHNFYGSSSFNSNQSNENQTQIALIFSLGNTAGYSGSGKMKLYNPASASLYKQVDFHTACSASDNHFYTGLGAGRYKNTTAVNAIRFLMSTGNIASGVIRMYGIAKV